MVLLPKARGYARVAQLPIGKVGLTAVATGNGFNSHLRSSGFESHWGSSHSVSLLCVHRENFVMCYLIMIGSSVSLSLFIAVKEGWKTPDSLICLRRILFVLETACSQPILDVFLLFLFPCLYIIALCFLPCAIVLFGKNVGQKNSKKNATLLGQVEHHFKNFKTKAAMYQIPSVEKTCGSTANQSGQCSRLDGPSE